MKQIMLFCCMVSSLLASQQKAAPVTLVNTWLNGLPSGGISSPISPDVSNSCISVSSTNNATLQLWRLARVRTPRDLQLEEQQESKHLPVLPSFSEEKEEQPNQPQMSGISRGQKIQAFFKRLLCCCRSSRVGS